MMKPLDHDLPLLELIARAVANLSQFDQEAHDHWLATDKSGIVDVAHICPPDRLYRLHYLPGVKYVVVKGYKAAAAGYPAHCIVRALDQDRMLGALPEALEDVTMLALTGQLPEQQG